MVADSQLLVAEDGLLTVTFIMLCHDSVERIVNRARLILDNDSTCRLIVHFDKKASLKVFQTICYQLDSHPRCHVMRNRVRCGWGQWGLVEAPLRALRYAFKNGFMSDYFYLISEYCYPTKPLVSLREYLTRNAGMEFIECKDKDWIKAGIREDRYLFVHLFDKRKHPRLHRWMYKCQKKVGLKKRTPRDLNVHFGSQWWCLTRFSSYNLLVDNEDLYFFKYSWIPDECAIQTRVAALVDQEKISKPLTHYEFDDSGRPIEFFDTDSLADGLTHFFVRKLI